MALVSPPVARSAVLVAAVWDVLRGICMAFTGVKAEGKREEEGGEIMCDGRIEQEGEIKVRENEDKRTYSQDLDLT